jgi:hypothetical protein
MGVVQTHMIDCERPPKHGKSELRRPQAGGFARQDDPRVLPKFPTQHQKLCGGELVKNEIADHRAVGSEAFEMKQIGLMPKLRGRPIGGLFPQVQSIHGDRLGRKARGEFAQARAEFEGPLALAELGRQGLRKPTMISHQAVDEVQIATISQGVRMVGWKRIEDLGFEDALHGQTKIARLD